MDLKEIGTGHFFMLKEEGEIMRSGFLPREKHWNWKGGITHEHKKIKNSAEFKLWKRSVLERDNFTCIWCESKIDVIADHIKPFAYYPELRFAIDNGRVLCGDCHRKTDTYGKHIESKEATERLIAYNHSKKGKKLPESHRKNISLALKGRKLSPAHIKKLSDSHKKLKP